MYVQSPTRNNSILIMIGFDDRKTYVLARISESDLFIYVYMCVIYVYMGVCVRARARVRVRLWVCVPSFGL